MVNILHSSIAINEKWCFDTFSKYIKPQNRVLVIGLSFRDTQVANKEQWEDLYGKNGGKYYESIVQSFAPYGIMESDFEWVNYFSDSSKTAKTKIKNADILYFPGGLPDKLYSRAVDLDLLEDIRSHSGVIMGFSAGAMAQLSEYHITPDKDYPDYCYGKGFGLIDNFGIDVHYDATDEIQHKSIKRFIAEKKKPLYAIADDGAVIVSNGNIAMLGNVAYFDCPISSKKD